MTMASAGQQVGQQAGGVRGGVGGVERGSFSSTVAPVHVPVL